jgi:hypothetical protein
MYAKIREKCKEAQSRCYYSDRGLFLTPCKEYAQTTRAKNNDHGYKTVRPATYYRVNCRHLQLTTRQSEIKDFLP